MDLSVFEAARAKPAPKAEDAPPSPTIVDGVDVSFFESARAKPAPKPRKPRPMDDAFDAETRKDTFSIGGAAAAVGKRLASFTIGNAAAIVDMIAGAPADLAAIGIEGRKRAEMQYDPLNPRPISPVKTLRSKSDTEIAKEAAKLKSDFREKYGEPLKKVLTHLGVEDIYNTSEVAQALQFLGGKIQEGGGALEKATGGKVRSEDALALFEQTLAAAGVAGTPAALRTTAKAAPKVVRGLEPQANFPVDGKIAQVNMPPLPALPAGLNEALMRPIELRVGRRLASGADIRRAEAELNNDAVRNGLLDAPSLVDAWQKRRDKAQGPELDAMRNAEQQAYKLLQSGASTQQVERALATARSRGIPLEQAMEMLTTRREGRSAFADIPEVPIREDGTFAPRANEALLRSETAPSRTELAARIAAQGGRIDPALGVGESAPGGRVIRRPSAVRYDEFGNPIPPAQAAAPGIDPALATRMYGAGSDMALEEARAGKAEAEAARARAQALERNTNWLYSILGDIRDPQAFEARRMQILSSPGLVTTPENQALLQGTSFEQYRAFPQLVEAERKRALDAVAANRANTLKRFAGASETNAATRAAAEVRRREQGDLRTKTDGTKPIERPAPKDVEQALVYIKNTAEGKDLSGVPLRSAASDVAARALRIHRENPAVSIDVARSRALEELKKTQALRQESTVFGGKRWSYNSLGAEVTPTGRPSGAPRVAPPQPGERTATNPKTGERMVYRNGKWEKLQ